MLTAILLIMIMAAISVLMLGVVVAQKTPTVFADKNGQTVFASEAGLDAALSQLRSSLGAPDLVTGKIYGDPRLLPCTVQGSVNSAGTPLKYKVNVTYFDQSPTGKDATWRAANKLLCSPTTGVAIAPSFALLSSEGVDADLKGLATGAGNRTIETVYTFQVSNNNIDGGTIYTFGDKHCLQATGQTVGSKVVYVDAADCREDDPRRLWTYGKDYSPAPVGFRPRGHALVHHRQCQRWREHRHHADQVHGRATPPRCSAGRVGRSSTARTPPGTNYANLCLSAGAVYADADLVGKNLKYGTLPGRRHRLRIVRPRPPCRCRRGRQVDEPDRQLPRVRPVHGRHRRET